MWDKVMMGPVLRRASCTQLCRVTSAANDTHNICPARKPRRIAWQPDVGNDLTNVVNCFDNSTGAVKLSKSALQTSSPQDPGLCAADANG